jgi:predicted metalloprotease
VRKRGSRRGRTIAACLAVVGLLAGCSNVVDGAPTVVDAPNANLTVKGATTDHFDTEVKNALTDIMAFWRTAYPTISGGKALTPLKGGFYSVDGLQVAETGKAPASAQDNQCVQQTLDFVVNNGAYCRLDDSISWDRAPTHLFAKLADKYGDLMVALIFAHEFGHAISQRLGVFDTPGIQTINTESQADCAAGAWAASALAGQDPHFRDVTPQKLDDAMEGFLNGRDNTPETPDEVSHGNGFDRLSALADGIQNGVKYCYSPDYLKRTFTERPYSSAEEQEQGDNSPLSDVLATSADNVFVKDLNRFWTGKAETIKKTFKPVSIKQATSPPCQPKSEFGYCPDDNTVYYNADFAKQAYYSLPAVAADGSEKSQNVKIVDNQPGDFALGVLFSIAWGMAVRHQLFGRSLDGQDALTAAVCYSGSYAKDVNVPPDTPGKDITLSPADLDEAVSSMLDEVGRQQAFGNEGTTGLSRVQDFVKGYKGGLSVC